MTEILLWIQYYWYVLYYYVSCFPCSFLLCCALADHLIRDSMLYSRYIHVQ